MITVTEMRELIKKSGLTAKSFTLKTGKGDKNLLVSICNNRSGMLGERISRNVAKTYPKLVKDYYGSDIYDALVEGPFMDVDHTGELICILDMTMGELASAINRSNKFLYVTLINQNGISYKLAAEIYKEFPDEVKEVLSKGKIKLLNKYIDLVLN